MQGKRESRAGRGSPVEDQLDLPRLQLRTDRSHLQGGRWLLPAQTRLIEAAGNIWLDVGTSRNERGLALQLKPRTGENRITAVLIN